MAKDLSKDTIIMLSTNVVIVSSDKRTAILSRSYLIAVNGAVVLI